MALKAGHGGISNKEWEKRKMAIKPGSPIIATCGSFDTDLSTTLRNSTEIQNILKRLQILECKMDQLIKKDKIQTI